MPKIVDIKTFLLGNVFVKVETDEGIYGLGEAGITRQADAIANVIEQFKALLIGQDTSRIEHIWQLLFRGGFFPGGNIVSSALSAIDIALWDIWGKVLNVPIYKLLGGLVREKVVCYPHIGGSTLVRNSLY